MNGSGHGDGHDHEHTHRHAHPHGHGHHHEGDHHDGSQHAHSGPEGTEFLDLEISKVVQSEAASLTREAARSLIRAAIEARLRERVGAKLEAIGRIVADELVDDFEANQAIEELIASRRETRKSTEARVREALRGGGAAPVPTAPKAPARRGRAR